MSGRLEEWGIREAVLELRAQGLGFRRVAKAVYPEIEEWARRLGRTPPSPDAVTMTIYRALSREQGRAQASRELGQELQRWIRIAQGILTAVIIEAPDRAPAIIRRLQLDPETEAALRLPDIIPRPRRPRLSSAGAQGSE